MRFSGGLDPTTKPTPWRGAAQLPPRIPYFLLQVWVPPQEQHQLPDRRWNAEDLAHGDHILGCERLTALLHLVHQPGQIVVGHYPLPTLKREFHRGICLLLRSLRNALVPLIKHTLDVLIYRRIPEAFIEPPIHRTHIYLLKRIRRNRHD